MKLHIGKMYNRFDQHRNDEEAAKMSAYMKDKFLFLGLKTKPRRELTKSHNKDLALEEKNFLKFAKICFEYPEREMHHYALDTIASFKKKHNAQSLNVTEYFCEKNAWWDTVDMANSFINKNILQKDEKLLIKKTLEWMKDENFWKRRLAIISQLKFKLDTNTDLLEEVVNANLGSNEFFINKAIGWALRDYGDHNRDWVLNFAAQTDLEPLSRREALRKIL